MAALAAEPRTAGQPVSGWPVRQPAEHAAHDSNLAARSAGPICTAAGKAVLRTRRPILRGTSPPRPPLIRSVDACHTIECLTIVKNIRQMIDVSLQARYKVWLHRSVQRSRRNASSRNHAARISGSHLSRLPESTLQCPHFAIPSRSCTAPIPIASPAISIPSSTTPWNEQQSEQRCGWRHSCVMQHLPI